MLWASPELPCTAVLRIQAENHAQTQKRPNLLFGGGKSTASTPERVVSVNEPEASASGFIKAMCEAEALRCSAALAHSVLSHRKSRKPPALNPHATQPAGTFSSRDTVLSQLSRVFRIYQKKTRGAVTPVDSYVLCLQVLCKNKNKH